MTVPMVTTGRGAWTSIGKDNKNRYYRRLDGLPIDGSSPTKDVNYQAVHLGVLALQKRMNAFAIVHNHARVQEDGTFGLSDAALAKWVQKLLGFTGQGIDGVIGPATARRMWVDLVKCTPWTPGSPAHTSGA